MLVLNPNNWKFWINLIIIHFLLLLNWSQKESPMHEYGWRIEPDLPQRLWHRWHRYTRDSLWVFLSSFFSTYLPMGTPPSTPPKNSHTNSFAYKICIWTCHNSPLVCLSNVVNLNCKHVNALYCVPLICLTSIRRPVNSLCFCLLGKLRSRLAYCCFSRWSMARCPHCWASHFSL